MGVYLGKNNLSIYFLRYIEYIDIFLSIYRSYRYWSIYRSYRYWLIYQSYRYWSIYLFWFTIPSCPTVKRLKIPFRYLWPACDQMGKIQKFWHGESIFLLNFASVVRKVSLQDFLPILATLQPKIPLLSIGVQSDGTFYHSATRSYVRYFRLWCNYFPISILSTNGATNRG